MSSRRYCFMAIWDFPRDIRVIRSRPFQNPLGLFFFYFFGAALRTFSGRAFSAKVPAVDYAQPTPGNALCLPCCGVCPRHVKNATSAIGLKGAPGFETYSLFRPILYFRKRTSETRHATLNNTNPLRNQLFQLRYLKSGKTRFNDTNLV